VMLEGLTKPLSNVRQRHFCCGVFIDWHSQSENLCRLNNRDNRIDSGG
jgi:hypothetical protein